MAQENPEQPAADEPSAKPTTDDQPASLDFPVVGLGASAGGLEAAKTFFRAMPPDAGLAFVLVQHLDPTRVSLMAELITAETPMPVIQAHEPTRIQSNHVYIIPPNAYLSIDQGVLTVTEPDEPRGRRRPIDIFFRSLARDLEEKAIAVVLSGAGSNGADGLKDIKAHGGLILVQEPDSAAHDGMPKAAIATGLADYILPVAKMPEALLEYLRHAYATQTPTVDKPALPGDQFDAILGLLRARHDRDFRYYKRGTLLRRIQRRMSLNHIQDSGEYLAYLRQRPLEVDALAQDLMISVTHFFRDPEAWAYLEKTVLPELLAQKAGVLRAWTPGCATGEEAYTLAMLLLERLPPYQKGPLIQVFASDMNAGALARARSGLYADGIAADLAPARLQRFFREEDGYYRVTKELRDVVTFALQNLISDPPFGRLDLISCRNVLIYLEPAVQEKVIGLFHFALNPGGYLFLGNAETIGSQKDLFEVVSNKWRIYRRVGPARLEKLALPLPTGGGAARPVIEPKLNPFFLSPPSSRLAGVAQQLVLERYTRACVLINRNHEMLYLFGPTADYLAQPTGELKPDLLLWLREGLRGKVRAGLHQAIRGGDAVTIEDMHLRRDNQVHEVRCVIEPLTVPKEAAGLLLVAFDERPAVEAAPAVSAEAVDDSIVTQLEYELKLTKDELHAAVEQLESANEEFKATTEEVMSINEELQSTNEELETSKEELQSLNEELITTNQQLESKNHELESANDDLRNLLASTQIATLFLDRHYRIRRFTPAMTQLMRLIAADIGRSIEDITSKINNADLLRDAARVLEQLTPVESEVRTDDGGWYLRRTLPYRTEDNRIDGVVITFMETTEHKQAESRQRFLVEFNDALRPLQTPEEIIAAAARLTGQYFQVSRCAYGVIDELRTQVIVDQDYCDQARSWRGTYTLANWDRGLLQDLRRGRPVASPDIRNDPRLTPGCRPPAIAADVRALLLAPVVRGDQLMALFTLGHRQPRAWSDQEIGLAMDLAERAWLAVEKARSEQALRLSEERFRIALQNSPITVFNQDPELRYTWAHNPTGFSVQQLLGKRDRDLLERPEEARELEAFKQQALAEGHSARRTVSVWSDDQRRWYDLTVEPLRDHVGQTTGLIGSAIDITERVRMETELRQQAEQLIEADRQKNNFLAMLGHELRNPLAPIRNVIDTLNGQLKRGAVDNNMLIWSLGVMDRQIGQLTLLVNDLLDVGRITQNKVELRKRPTALADIVRSAEETIRPLLDEHRQTLTIAAPPEPLTVDADPLRLAQVVTNLLNNAVKYTPRDGRIRLTLSRVGNEAEIRVRDTGKGIDPKLLPQVFDLFVQAEPDIARSQGGLGLGLTLARKLVELHGGSIEAASEGLDRGSEFTVRLPLLLEEADPPAEKAATTAATPAPVRRVLVVEDNPDIAESLALMLTMMGHTVETASDGDAALKIAPAFQPDAALLDIGLPGMDGYELARRLRRTWPPQKLLLIALTGYGQEKDRQLAKEAGFDHHVLKPGDPATLEALLAAFTPSEARNPPSE